MRADEGAGMNSLIEEDRILIRRSAPGDGAALNALAALDERDWAGGPALVAEVGGKVEAALPLDGFELHGTRPAHNDDQRDKYGDLVYNAPIGPGDLSKWFKDATFGVKPEDVESVEHPRDDVTIVRDRFGVPHVYGSTRDGTE